MIWQFKESESARNGGHSVSEEIVRRRYVRGLDNLFELYLPLADTWAIYDNSGNASPLLVAAGEKERTPSIVRQDLWQTLARNRE
jgi:predicted ABC-type ATPase